MPKVAPHYRSTCRCRAPCRRALTRSTSAFVGTRATTRGAPPDHLVAWDQVELRSGAGHAGPRVVRRRNGGDRRAARAAGRARALPRADRQRRLQADARTVEAPPRRRAGAAPCGRTRCRPAARRSVGAITQCQRTCADDGLGRVSPLVDVPRRWPTCHASGARSRCRAGSRSVRWFGRGPHENYPDRNAGARSACGRARPTCRPTWCRRSSGCAPTLAGWSCAIRRPASSCASMCSNRISLHMSATNYTRRGSVRRRPTRPILARDRVGGAPRRGPPWPRHRQLRPRRAAPVPPRSRRVRLRLPPHAPSHPLNPNRVFAARVASQSVSRPPGWDGNTRSGYWAGRYSGVASSIGACVGAHFRGRRRQGGPPGPPRPHPGRDRAHDAQLAGMLEHFADIDALDLDDVAADDPAVPAAQRVPRGRRASPASIVTRCSPRHPQAEDGRFRVPPIVGLDS